VSAPTPAALAFARSSLPTRRVSAVVPQPMPRGQFASFLQQASAPHRPLRPIAVPLRTFNTTLQPAPPAIVSGGPPLISRSEILSNAQRLIDIPYVWGGTTDNGLDCSAFLSKVWGVARHTTDTLKSVAQPISKDDLQPGDALNLTTAADPTGDGHVRLFDKWADAAHSRMWVYEETVPRSVHHVVPWDARYTPLRRQNVVEAS
jgi:cell wall-associated NlpC family hydrolase